jgi:predicted DNA-binding transcriptional regulator AlpA
MDREVMLAPVPSLDELAANPERAAEISPAAAAALLTRVAGLQPVLLARALATAGDGGHDGAPSADRLLTVKQAAAQLGHSEDWLYRHAAKFPFTVRTGRDVRFSAAGLARWIRNRQGR